MWPPSITLPKQLLPDRLLATIELNLASPDKAAAWVKSYQSPGEMTDLEIRMVESHLVALMLQWDYLFQMEARGLIPRAEVENHVRNTAPYYFGSRFGKAWFRGEAPGWQGTRMMEVAGPIVSGLPDDFMKTHYASLRAGALPPPLSGPGTRPREPAADRTRGRSTSR